MACTTDQTALPVPPVTSATAMAQPEASAPMTSAPVASAASMDPIASPSALTQDDSTISDRTQQPGQAGTARPEPAANKKPPPALDPQKLVGMDQGELSNLLGKPSLLRGEQDAQVWQYGGGSCVLHVFLYRDDANGRYRVAYVDTVSRQRRIAMQTDDATFKQTCLDRPAHRVTAQNQPN